MKINWIYVLGVLGFLLFLIFLWYVIFVGLDNAGSVCDGVRSICE